MGPDEKQPVAVPSPQKLLREFARLNRRRKDSGITPLELQRWLDLRSKLEKEFPGRPPPGGGTTHVVVGFESRHALRRAIMANLRPIGLFVPTPFAAEPGTKFELTVTVEETGESFTGPGIVASNNLGPGFSTQSLGMGVRFASEDCALRRALEVLYI